jgi:hypothetical protein
MWTVAWGMHSIACNGASNSSTWMNHVRVDHVLLCAGVLKSKFEEISRILLGLLEAGSNAEDAQVVRPILQCLGTMLAALDTPQLANKSVLHMFRV